MENEENKTPALNADNGGYKYKFSIIMAVYNVEEYIEEAVDSVIAQDIGFENVQIIMVDDGSKDNSGAICDKYQERYPNNITVIHKENGGLCSARNEGLKHIEGRYVNFFDPDDILSDNTLSSVYDFFIKNEKHVDIVAIPLYYFGDRKGPHHLNDKFAAGTRIINLEKEYQFSHLSAASSFFRHEIAAKQYYDPKLIIAEDAEQILKELTDNPLLGVVSNCKYYYRRRGNSQVTAGATKKGWYTDYLKYLCLRIFDYATEHKGFVPRFVQNAIMGDLRWRYTEPNEPPMLTAEEINEYKETLTKCTQYIDDKIIMSQKNLLIDTKLHILSKKHGDKYLQKISTNIHYGFDHRTDWSFNRNTMQVCFADEKGHNIILRVRQVILATHRYKIESAHILVGNEKIYSGEIEYEVHKTSVGEPVSHLCIYSFSIPRKFLNAKNTEISFYTTVDGVTVRNTSLNGGYLFPASRKYKNSFGLIDGLIYTVNRRSLFVSPSVKKDRRLRELKFLKELWKSNQRGERKAVIARILAKLYKKLVCKKPIWIITDRLNKAGDNGEAFFRYLKETKYKKASYYYAITDCADYRRLKPLGNVINHNSWKYKLMFLASDCILSSHADDFVINPFDIFYEPYRDIIKMKKFIFLQHGVTQNDISGWLNRYNKNIAGFVCAANNECKSIENGKYYYSKDKVWLTGFARFDRLYNDEKKYITIMPTWRKYLMSGYDLVDGVWKPGDNFKKSDYFNFYNSLINDPRLIEAARKHGYTICFMPHPNIITRTDLFDKNENVKFFTINDEYRKVYAESNLVLTDYSSAAFDFAYMRKPIVYSQFDFDDFFKGEHVVMRGYFDYEKDGFGEVTKDLDSTVDLLIEYIESDCKLKDKYRERIDSFFAYGDKNNCQRILAKIEELCR